MAKVASANEVGQRWAKGVEGKTEKFETNAKAGRAAGLEGLRSISGVTLGPQFTAAYNDASRISGAAWARGVQGKQEKMVRNWLAGLAR